MNLNLLSKFKSFLKPLLNTTNVKKTFKPIIRIINLSIGKGLNAGAV